LNEGKVMRKNRRKPKWFHGETGGEGNFRTMKVLKEYGEKQKREVDTRAKVHATQSWASTSRKKDVPVAVHHWGGIKKKD